MRSRASLAFLAALMLAGCAQMTTTSPPIEVFPDMDRQPKYKTQGASPFFADGRASQAPVPGTVAQGQLNEDEAFHAGLAGGVYVDRNPLGITMAGLERGRERFNIYCAPCHDRLGTGRGIVSLRSNWIAGSLQDQRIRDMSDGEIFAVISVGRRTMPAYRFQISAGDRWAIVAYVRALQRTTSGTVEDVPADLRGELR